MKLFLPTLFKEDAKGNKVEWSVFTEAMAEGCLLGSKYGRVGGKLQEHSILITSGKNLGRSNETNPVSQAILEAEALWNERLLRRGYSRDGEVREHSGVMLAVDYLDLGKRKKGVDLPERILIEPKLDGIRAKFLDNPNGDFVSRKELAYRAIPEIIRNYLRGRGKVDGEMYIHGVSLRKLNGVVNKEKPDLTSILGYHLFDLPIPGVPVEERKAKLKELFDNEEARANRVFVNPYYIIDSEKALEYKNRFVQASYEGAMINLIGSEYLFNNKRSYGLIKWKDFLEKEYVCLGVSKDREGNALLNFQTDDGSPFDCSIKADDEWKAELANNPTQIIGCPVTVRFQGYLDSGIPQFARAIVERDYE